MAQTFTIETTKYQGRYMYVTCTQTPDIESNTSRIDWTLTVDGGTSSFYSTGPTTVLINGTQVYYAGRTSYTKEIFPAKRGSVSGSLTVAHDVDGTKNVLVSITTAIYTQTTKTVDGTWELDSIPRFATIVSAPNAFHDEENPTITYSNPAGEAITSIAACISFDGINEAIQYQAISKLETSYTFELNDDEREILRKATLNGSRTIQVYFIVRSEIGDNSSTSSLVRDFYVINADPVLTTTIEDVDEKAKSLTGGGNNYIKGYSDLKIAMSAEAKKGAEIETYIAKIGDDIQTGTDIVFENIQSNDLFVKCQDNRGLSVEQQKNDDIQLIDYFKPTVSAKGKIEMDGETTAKVNIMISGTFFNDSFGVVDNAVDVWIYYTGADDWVSLTDTLSINGNSYSVEFSMSNLDYMKSFVYQVKIEDKLDSTSTTSYTLRMVPVFDWGENDFNFNVPIKLNNTPLFDVMFDLIYPVGSIYMSVNSVSPATIFGGEWEQIKDKFLLASGDQYEAGNTGGQSEITLTVDNMPSHSHEATSEYTGGSLLLRGPSDDNHNIADVSLGGGNITKTTYDGDAWANSISTSSTDRAPEQINIGGTVTTTIEPTGDGTPIDIIPPYLAVYMWRRTA